jgi:uncharacterized membrane protein
MELNEKLIEAIIMSATVGQFGTQIIEETFKLSIEELSAAKKQAYTALCSGVVAFTVYFFTQDAFVAKQAALAFLSGVFAEAALKMLKKKNEANAIKSTELASQLAELESKNKDDKIKQLEDKLKELEKKD